ncbi:MAG: response regulator [Nannocystaceae bacterium]|nr:response regulator [Nannocystaceae bacterium]
MPDAPTSRGERSRRVLLVDDERSMCEWLAPALEASGFVVRWFTSANEALAVLAQEDFGVAIADLYMPEMSGLEFCHRAARLRPALPVVTMTGFGTADTARAVERAGAFELVPKPFELETLCAALERALARPIP